MKAGAIVKTPAQYIAEPDKARLGKVSVGHSCIRVEKLEDFNLPVALELAKNDSALRSKQSGTLML